MQIANEKVLVQHYANEPRERLGDWSIGRTSCRGSKESNPYSFPVTLLRIARFAVPFVPLRGYILAWHTLNNKTINSVPLRKPRFISIFLSFIVLETTISIPVIPKSRLQVIPV